MSILQGIVCANITPFDDEKNVDYESVRKMAGYLADSGIHAVYPLGTNGEGLALTVEERKKIAETMIEEIAGKIYVAVQCGTQTLEDTIELVLHAKKAGADAAGVVSPFFFHQSDKALMEYYSAVLEAADDFPIYIYNIPANTNNDVSVEIVRQLAARYDNLAGVKFSYPDIMRICEYINTRKNGLDTLIGCDKLIYPAYKCGAAGTVTGPAAVFPEIFIRLWELAVSGNDKEALRLQYQIQKNSDRFAPYQEIPMIKQYLQSIGIIKSDSCRIPFYAISDEERSDISAIVREIKNNQL
ncbi:MAG: dihydrodipicolinate synthase family protein [Lachnospiraceae bacterium]